MLTSEVARDAEQTLIDDLLQYIEDAETDINWQIGRVAQEWTDKFSHGRSDQVFAEKIGRSRSAVNFARRIFIRFKHPCSLKWAWRNWVKLLALDEDVSVAIVQWAKDLDEPPSWRETVAYARVRHQVTLTEAPPPAKILSSDDAPPTPVVQPKPVAQSASAFSFTPPDNSGTGLAAPVATAPLSSLFAPPAAPQQAKPVSVEEPPATSPEKPKTVVASTAIVDGDDTEPDDDFRDKAVYQCAAAVAELKRACGNVEAAKFLLNEAYQLDPSLRPPATRTPTARELIDAMPDDVPEDLRPIAEDWADSKQSRKSSKDRFQDVRAWLACLRRMRLYHPPVVREAVDRAIAGGWKGWEQESTKEHLPQQTAQNGRDDVVANIFGDEW